LFEQLIEESGELALSWVKTHAYDLCITNMHTQDWLKVPDPIDVHLHLPAGAQKKDGPSAGVAMVCGFVLRHRCLINSSIDVCHRIVAHWGVCADSHCDDGRGTFFYRELT
jgi:ATP-dependent Lon protease